MINKLKKQHLSIILTFAIWFINCGTAIAVSTTSFSELSNQNILGKAEEAVGRKIGDYTLTNQDGERFHLNSLLDKPLIVSFVYTTCDYACPMITQHLQAAVKEAGRDFGKKFRIVTVSFDPEDTSESVRKFGGNFTNDFKNWLFATADKETIANLVKDVGLSYTKTGSGYQHINLFTIVDTKGTVYKQVYGIDFKPKAVLKTIDMAVEQKRLWVHFANIFDTIKSVCYTYDANTGRYVPNFAMLIPIILGVTTLSAIVFLFVYMLRGNRYREESRITPRDISSKKIF
ncbi:MAG: SCO family protein [Deltaproteobacteria bacterium]|nr:SCO family protein [Deltaproteobacteria bacterium]